MIALACKDNISLALPFIQFSYNSSMCKENMIYEFRVVTYKVTLFDCSMTNVKYFVLSTSLPMENAKVKSFD